MKCSNEHAEVEFSDKVVCPACDYAKALDETNERFKGLMIAYKAMRGLAVSASPDESAQAKIDEATSKFGI